MPYIDIHNERVWIPERPLRSMDEARPMRDGDLWRCPACGRELDEEENDDGTITLVCPAHQVAGTPDTRTSRIPWADWCSVRPWAAACSSRARAWPCAWTAPPR